MRGVSQSSNVPRSALLLILLMATDAVDGICVFENKKGWSLDCGMRDSYLFRIKDVGGIKANFDFGLGFGNEDGFEHSISHTSGHHFHHAHRKEDHVEESGDPKHDFPYKFENARSPGRTRPKNEIPGPKLALGENLLRPADSPPSLERLPPPPVLPPPPKDFPTRLQSVRGGNPPLRRHYRPIMARQRPARAQQKQQLSFWSFWSWLFPWASYFSETTEAPQKLQERPPPPGQERVTHSSMGFVEAPQRPVRPFRRWRSQPSSKLRSPPRRHPMRRQFISTGNIDGRKAISIPGTNAQVVVIREEQPTPPPRTPHGPTVGPSMAEVLQSSFKNPSDHQQVSHDTPADTDHVPSFAAKMFVVREAPKELHPPGYKAPVFFPVVNRKVQVPRTKFFCEDQKYLPGLYADRQLGCKVFHMCLPASVGNTLSSFMCPNMTLFDQSILQCNWWYNVECEQSVLHYDANLAMAQSYRKINAANLPLSAVQDFSSVALLSTSLDHQAGLHGGFQRRMGTVDRLELGRSPRLLRSRDSSQEQVSQQIETTPINQTINETVAQSVPTKQANDDKENQAEIHLDVETETENYDPEGSNSAQQKDLNLTKKNPPKIVKESVINNELIS